VRFDIDRRMRGRLVVGCIEDARVCRKRLRFATKECAAGCEEWSGETLRGVKDRSALSRFVVVFELMNLLKSTECARDSKSRISCKRTSRGVGADREKVKEESVGRGTGGADQRHNAPNKSRSGLAAVDCRGFGG